MFLPGDLVKIVFFSSWSADLVEYVFNVILIVKYFYFLDQQVWCYYNILLPCIVVDKFWFTPKTDFKKFGAIFVDTTS